MLSMDFKHHPSVHLHSEYLPPPQWLHLRLLHAVVLCRVLWVRMRTMPPQPTGLRGGCPGLRVGQGAHTSAAGSPSPLPPSSTSFTLLRPDSPLGRVRQETPSSGRGRGRPPGLCSGGMAFLAWQRGWPASLRQCSWPSGSVEGFSQGLQRDPAPRPSPGLPTGRRTSGHCFHHPASRLCNRRRPPQLCQQEPKGRRGDSQLDTSPEKWGWEGFARPSGILTHRVLSPALGC